MMVPVPRRGDRTTLAQQFLAALLTFTNLVDLDKFLNLLTYEEETAYLLKGLLRVKLHFTPFQTPFTILNWLVFNFPTRKYSLQECRVYVCFCLDNSILFFVVMCQLSKKCLLRNE